MAVFRLGRLLIRLTPFLLNPCQREIDEICEDKQQRGKSQRLPEFTFARFKDNRGRQHTRLPADIASHHHRRADLRDNGTEPSHERGQERQTCLSPQVPDHLAA